MNKNILIGIIVLLIVSIIFNYKFYISNKKNVLNEQNYLIKLEKKIKEINYLKNKYKFNINSLKKYCDIKTLPTKYIVKCSNLERNKFLKVQEIFKRTKLYRFSIEKKDKVNIFLEIIK